MTDGEKRHDIQNALHLIETVKEDTDEDTWAWEFLANACAELRQYFEESEI